METPLADRGAARPPPTHDHQLQEMQRLLGETWRYQQLGTAVTSNTGSTQGVRGTSTAISGCRAGGAELQGSPLHFSCGDDDRHCAPPPICSDLVEVGGTKKQMTDPYVFLGRLVATLPEEAQGAPVDTSRGGSGPCQPQAVVECNFWQLREALGDPNTQTRISDSRPIGTVVPPLHASSSSHGHTITGASGARQFPTLVPPPSALAPWPSTAGVHGVPAPMGLQREDHGPRYHSIPPWPHSTLRDRDAKDSTALPPWPHEM